MHRIYSFIVLTIRPLYGQLYKMSTFSGIHNLTAHNAGCLKNKVQHLILPKFHKVISKNYKRGIFGAMIIMDF